MVSGGLCYDRILQDTIQGVMDSRYNDGLDLVYKTGINATIAG